VPEHDVQEPRAFGLIETRGLVAAIVGADAAATTADVRLLGRDLVRDGIVTVKLAGQVADVRAAIDAGAAAASRVGILLSAHVIPSPGAGVRQLVDGRHPQPSEDRSQRGADEPRGADQESAQRAPEGAASRRAALEAMTLRELRALARAQRRLGDSEVRRSRKDRLIELMLAAEATGDDGTERG